MTQTFYLQNIHGGILCSDGTIRPERIVCIGGFTAKTWKTRAGAQRFADERWNANTPGYMTVQEEVSR